ncbi:glycosyltransferase family 2 protein [Clostridium grantii]|uniref:Glycosyltransferase involved in cell wall bisynthesis n=1 Tax=Clostridium grantii DSM 8605 TaxID=1121316 RepID=A0A1M5UZR9_9CLOT|nr:glycosyltransferase [Clostridium grantii]SHH68410.1 Glycosyltransferase involved in cell wall bisynthesis [Clostridium grantii DSM 8605]
MNPKISIIVPIYKVEAYLQKCIDSILVQTFNDFELILVDDGSPDKCGRICDEYVKKDKRIKVIHKLNGGLSSARNAGIDIAQGKYIGFVDSDDYIHTRMYEVLYNSAVEYLSDIIMCDYSKVSEGQVKELINFNTNSKIEHFTNTQALEQLFTKNGVGFVVAWNKLYRKELFKNLRFAEGRIHEDEFIAHKILYKSTKITYVSIYLYYYLQRNNSIMGSQVRLKKLDFLYALKERTDFFKSIKQEQLQYKAEKTYIWVLIGRYYKTKSELTNVNKELREMKKMFNKVLNLRFLLNNNNFTWKEKLKLLLFKINPVLYNLYNKTRMNFIEKRI